MDQIEGGKKGKGYDTNFLNTARETRSNTLRNEKQVTTKGLVSTRVLTLAASETAQIVIYRETR